MRFKRSMANAKQIKEQIRLAKERKRDGWLAREITDYWNAIESGRFAAVRMQEMAMVCLASDIARIRRASGLTQSEVGRKLAKKLKRTEKGAAGLVCAIENNCSFLTTEILTAFLDAVCDEETPCQNP